MITAAGRAFHHFHGTYSASIVLTFHSPELAATALRLHFSTDWRQSDRLPACLVLDSCSEPALADVVAFLVEHEAEEDKILSLKYSIDSGEPFTACFNLVEPDPAVQLELGL